MRIAAYVAYAIVSIPGVVAGGRKGVVAIEGVFSHPLARTFPKRENYEVPVVSGLVCLRILTDTVHTTQTRHLGDSTMRPRYRVRSV